VPCGHHCLLAYSRAERRFCRPSLYGQVAIQEIVNQRDHFVSFVFGREMAGTEEMKLDFWQIAFVEIGAVSGKDDVILTPDDECRRLPFAKIGKRAPMDGLADEDTLALANPC
jgi:hypothetical protein